MQKLVVMTDDEFLNICQRLNQIQEDIDSAIRDNYYGFRVKENLLEIQEILSKGGMMNECNN